jgi:ubiquinone biosynthesis protein
MFNWNSLLDEVAISAVLSDEYVRFARPVWEGLIRFLESSPAAYQQEIVDQQATLPSTTSLPERLALLGRCCPVLNKLGQILARDQRLAPELRVHLRELESFPPTQNELTIRTALAREFGPLELRGVRLVLPAIAEASVATVVPFVQERTGIVSDDIAARAPQQGVFKILKPGIEERLELELDLLTKVGSYLEERCLDLGIPPLDYSEVFQQIGDKLRSEVRLNEEQKHLVLAADLYADEPRVHIPMLLDHCTSRVTAMERIVGVKVTDKSSDNGDERSKLADLVIRGLIAQPFFARIKPAMFHSDPHAGNLFVTHDNRLAILDWSLVGWLTESELLGITQLLQAAVSLNEQQLIKALQRLAKNQASGPALGKIVRQQLAQIIRGHFPGLKWLVGLFDASAQAAGMRFTSDLLMMRKSLHTLDGVLTELGMTSSQIDRTLLVSFVDHFLAEWPRRWMAAPTSHDFVTHLSNVDMAQLALSIPSTLNRICLCKSFDLLDVCCRTGKLHQNKASSAYQSLELN